MVFRFFLDFRAEDFEVAAEAAGLRFFCVDDLPFTEDDGTGAAASDWAYAGCKIPSQGGEKIKTENATAKPRTKTLPTA